MGRRRGKKKSRRPKGKRNNNPTARPPPWIELPRDVILNILRRLSPEEIMDRAERVCSTWRIVCAEPSLWRVIDMDYSGTLDHDDIVCRRAVDRSRGELIDINIKRFGTDGLLRFISDRSCHLRVLTLQCCYFMSGQVLAKAVKNFPHLEELHIIIIPTVCATNIEDIGVSCPMLKSFSFNSHYYKPENSFIENSSALSIAKTMPNLVRLCLVGNLLGNEGLLAILDGCPNLEFLDLRQCYGVDLLCDVGRRCIEQIRELRCPLDSTDRQLDGVDYGSNSGGYNFY